MSSQPSLVIRIGADASGATQTIHQVTNQIGALGSQTNNTTNHINHYNNVINQTVNNSRSAANATQSLHGAMSGLQGVVGGIVSAFSLFKMREMIDDWAKLEGRIKLVSNSMQEVRDVQVGISEIAQRTRSDLQSTTELYARLAQAMEGTGKASKELLQLTETTNKAMIISGANSVEVKNALIQFGQALSSNRLGGDELRSMAEQAPRLVRAIRENLEGLTGGIGVTQAEFKKLAEDSYLTTERVTDALNRAKGQLDKEFQFMPTTIGQAFTGLNNKLFEFIGAGSQANGVGRAIASTIQMITDNFDGIISGLTIVAGGFLGYRTAVMLATAATEGFAIISAALNPAVWVGAAIAAVIAFRDEMVQIGDKTASIEAIVKAAWNNIQTSFANAWATMKEIAANSVNFISTKIDALKAKFQWLISVNEAIQKMADYTPTGMISNWIFSDKHKQDAQNFITDIGKTANGTLAEFAAQAEREQKKMTDTRNAQKSKDDAEMAAYKKTPEQQAAELAAKKAQEAAKKLREFNAETGSEMQKALAKEQDLLEEWQSKLGKLTDEQKQQIHNTAFSGLNKQHAAEAKKAQSELNKEQEHYKKLIESTPIGKYNADMADLNTAIQKGKIDQETYNYLTAKAASEYEKATVGIEKMTQAEKERQRVFEQTSRGKFEKQMDELRAAKPFMSESEYSNKQDKINVDYLKDSGLNPNAKTQIEAATDATKKFDDALKQANNSLYEIGNNGSMAFDGILGGVSAVSGAFENFGSMLEKQDKQFAEFSDKYKEAMLSEGITAQQRSQLTKAYHSEKEKYEAASNAATLSGMRQIMGASSKMFSEQSAARKTFHAIEVALSVVEIALSIKKTAIKLAEGASTMFAQSGWAGFAGVGLMVAVMAGLGFGSSGGSSGKMPEYTKTTGTVLGDSEAQSQSIKTVTDKLDEIHARELPQLRAIAVGMSDLKTSISSLMTTVFRAGGVQLATVQGGQLNDNSAKMAMLNGAGMIASVAMGVATLGMSLLVNAAVYALSKVPIIGDIISGITNFIGNGLFGKVTQKVVGGGIQIQQQSLGSIMDSGDIDAQVATEIERKKKSWFKTSTKIIEVLSDLDKNISTGIAKVFTNMGNSVLNYWNYITGGFDKGKIIGGDMEAGLEKLRSFMIPFSNIKTFGLKDEEIQKAFDNYSSMTFDKMVQHVFGGFVAQFQKLGETMAEAMNRIVTEAAQTRSSFRNMGVDLDSSNEHVVIFTQSLSNMAGGIKNLTALVDNFTSKFTTPEVKQRTSKEDLTAFINDPKNMEALKSQGLDMSAFQNVLGLIGNPNVTAAQISEAKNSVLNFSNVLTKKSQELSSTSDAYQSVKATQAADMAFKHESPEITQAEKNDIDTLVKAIPQTWGKLTYATTTEQAKAIAGVYWANLQAYGSVASLFAKNDLIEQQGKADLSAQGLESGSKTDFEAKAAAEYAKAKPIQDALLNTLALADPLSALLDTASNFTKIAEKTALLFETAGARIDAQRKNEREALGTDLEKSANDAYYNRFDQKKFQDDALAAQNKIFDLQHTAAQIAVENLNRQIEKLKDEATAIDKANGYLVKRINFLKQEFAAQQLSNYDKKLRDLKSGFTDIFATDVEKQLSALNKGIEDLRDNFVEVTDASGKVLNPLQTLIDLLTDTTTANSLKQASDALGGFKKSVTQWLDGMKTKEVGNTKSQLETAQNLFNEKYQIITDSTGKYSNEQKNQAMSEITGVADTMVEKIRAYGANGDWAQGQIKDLMAKMQTLPDEAIYQALIDQKLTPVTMQEALDKSEVLKQTAGNTKAIFDALNQTNGSIEIAGIGTLTTSIDGLAAVMLRNQTPQAVIDSVVSNQTPIFGGDINDFSAEVLKNGAPDLSPPTPPLQERLTTAWDALTVPNQMEQYLGGRGLLKNDLIGEYIGSLPTDYFISETFNSPEMADFLAANPEIQKTIDSSNSPIDTQFIEFLKNWKDKKRASAAHPERDIQYYFPGKDLSAGNFYGDVWDNAKKAYELDHPDLSFDDEYIAFTRGIRNNQKIPDFKGYTPPAASNPVTFEENNPGFDEWVASGNKIVNDSRIQAGLPALGDVETKPDAKANPATETKTDIQTTQPVVETKPATKVLHGAITGDVVVPADWKPNFSASTSPQDAGSAQYWEDNKDRIPEGSTTFYGENTKNGLFGTSQDSGMYRTYGTENQNSRNSVNLQELANNGNFYGISQVVQQASNANYFSAQDKQLLNGIYDRTVSGQLSVGANLRDELDAAKNLKLFAKGGISNEPAIFGEAGWEAAVPLPDGRTIPVTIEHAPFPEIDFSRLEGVLVEGFGELFERIEKLEKAVTGEQRKTTNATAQTGEKIYLTQKARALN